MVRITGRAVLIDGDEIILMFRRKKKHGILVEYYGLPGGGVENDETPEEATKREIKEEFNLDIEVKELLGVVGDEKTLGYVYNTKIIGGELELGGEEKEHNSKNNYYEPRRIKLSDIDDINLYADNKNIIKQAIKMLKK